MKISTINPNPIASGLEVSNCQGRNTSRAQGGRDDGELSHVSTSADSAADVERSRGVVRLLQEGHFKGVADVRLRINFRDELKEAEQGQIRATVVEKVDDVVGSVRLNVESLVESGELSQELYDTLLETFEQEASQARDEFYSSETPSQEVLTIGLEATFETLATSLSEFLAPAEDPQELPADPVEESTEPDEAVDIVSSLRSSFQEALDGLITAINEAEILPPISGPNGNGVAYDKFLAIYNGLSNVEPTNNEPGETDSLDMLA